MRENWVPSLEITCEKDYLGAESKLLVTILSLIISCLDSLDIMFTQNRIFLFFHQRKFKLIYFLFLSKRQQHSEEMKKHLAQLKTRRLYFEQIASERAAKEAEAEETEKIRVS